MNGVNDFSTYSDWTVTMIEAKIHEIENQLLTLEQEYKNKTSHLLIDLGMMYKLRRIKQWGKDEVWMD